MSVRGFNSQAEKLDGFTWRSEADTRIGKNHHAKGYQEPGNKGFYIHFKQGCDGVSDPATLDHPDQDDDDSHHQQDVDESAHGGGGHYAQQP